MLRKTVATVARSRVGTLFTLFGVELLILAVLYQFFAEIECYRLEDAGTCSFLRSLVARSMILMAVSILLIGAWPTAFTRFAAAADAHAKVARPRALHVFGIVLLLVPLGLAWGRDLGAMFGIAFWPWALGALLAAGGGLAWMAPRKAWMALISQDRFAMVPILLIAVVLPDLADRLRPIWDLTVVTDSTFASVGAVLSLFSDRVVADPVLVHIGIENGAAGFVVHVGQPCSGVEGFALVCAFVLIYGYVFRRDLVFPRYWIVVLPVGLALSWILNVVRISALILIGAHVSPSLAVNGFHSYAGWLFFTLLALALVFWVQMTPWLHRGGKVPRPGLPLRQDPVAASILPFVAFMLISTALSAVLIQPELGYPAKVLVLAAMLLFFGGVLRALPWGWDPVGLSIGGIVGLFWVRLATPPDPSLALALQGLPGLALAGWVALRLIGTIILVPVVEEMFFRGYILSRLDGPNLWRRILAIAASSVAFGLLHGRWVEAGLAGVLFALVMLRRGRVTDAIQAHVAANLVVAVFAVARGDFGLI